MYILVAPDSFKTSLSATDFCQISQDVIAGVYPKARIESFPLADGGEGSLEAVEWRQGHTASRRSASVLDPLGRSITAEFLILHDKRTALVEMAQASGFQLVSPTERDAMHSSSYGTGQLLAQALEEPVDEIVLACGGSATVDGGAGMLQALGFGLLDNQGQPIPPGPAGLAKLHTIDRHHQHPRLSQVKVRLACDVGNPLLGPEGAAPVFGPQKGLSSKQVAAAARALEHWAAVGESAMGVQLSAQPFTGAAGGLPFAAQLFFGAQPEWGFDVISQLVELPAAFASGPPDLVITGEGRFDRQTDQGKLISRLAKVCQTNQVPCIALVGQREESVSTAGWGAFTCLAISTGPMPLAEARQRTPQMLRETLRSVLKIYDFGRSAAT